MKRLFKYISFVFLIAIIATLSSCFFERTNDNDKVLTEKKVQFTSLAEDYTVNDTEVNLYFYENGNVPLIEVTAYYNMLTGYYDNSQRDVSINTLFNRLYIASTSNSAIRTIFDWKYNTVTFKNTLSVYPQKSNESTDFSSYYDLKLAKGITSLELEYYLEDYGVDILYYNDKVLMPLGFLNFMNSDYYNVVYNGTKLYGFYYDDDMTDVYNTDLNGKEIPDDLVLATKNELLFLLNEKYGLKEYNNVTDYGRTISSDIMNKISSKNAETRVDGFVEIVNGLLDDPHSRMMTSSFYSTNKDNLNGAKYHTSKERYVNISATFRELRGYFSESEKYNQPIYYKNDTLFITFDGFEVGKKEEVYQSEGVYKEDAYLKDTAALFYKALNDCKDNHPEVKNVVIDVSINGGGYIAAMYRALTFLSDNDIYFGYQVGKDAVEVYNLIGDPNMDGNNDNDSFGQYNYYILESGGTFSAANAFTCFAKYSGIAKTIGKRSGGGMCAVMPYILSDGTQFTLSDSTQQVAIRASHDKFYVYEIESGAPVDIALEYKDFYNLDKIIELIHAN